MKFSDLDLLPEILSAVEKLGFQECTPIQESAMPPILEGKDVAGLAQTGTGKTAAFVVPLLDRLIRSKEMKNGNLTAPESSTQPAENSSEAAQENKDSVEADQSRPEKVYQRTFPEWKAQEFILVLVPTRELVDQVAIEIEKLRGSYPVRVLAIYGGTGYDKQIDGIKNGVDFIVGTPGRLIDLYKTHAVDFRQVRAIVFDEADRMFDMGFRDDMQFILRRVPKTRQFLVFSATLNFEVLNIAYMHGAEPVECNVSRDQAKAENVKDQIYHCGHNDKPQFLLSFLKKQNPKQVIIFSNFKHNVERIAQFLNANEYPAVAISSLLTQSQRNRVIEQFKAENHLNILVATDLAARGLDIKGVDMIINFELPDDPENYVHRIGRTGRAGEEGQALSLVGDRDVEALQRIEDYLKHKISIGWMDDSDLLKEFKEFPHGEARMRSSQGRPERSGGGRQGRDTNRGGRDRPRDNFRGPRPDRPRIDGNRTEERPSPEGQSGGDRQQRADRHQRLDRQERNQRFENRNRNRTEGGPRTDPQGNGQTAPGGGQHRDRLTGRHSRPGQAQAPSVKPGQRSDNRIDQRPQRNDQKNGQKNYPRHDRKFDQRRGPDRRQGAKPSHQGKSTAGQSVGQKISGFFKGLFGRSS